MLLDVSTFRQRTRFGLDSLVAELQNETRRVGSSEAVAWRNSLPALAEVLEHPSLQSFHVQVGRSHDLAIEYRLPASTSCVDAILLGRGARHPTVVAIELKDWRTEGDRPGSREGLIHRFGRETLHPSDQVRGYVEYCRRFHSAELLQEARTQRGRARSGSQALQSLIRARGVRRELENFRPGLG